ncbi:hypothetical protein MMC19_000631 [Ptychographa xylographoides]|nr:hypothetical protein [Ptychographa xylographoides]
MLLPRQPSASLPVSPGLDSPRPSGEMVLRCIEPQTHVDGQPTVLFTQTDGRSKSRITVALEQLVRLPDSTDSLLIQVGLVPGSHQYRFKNTTITIMFRDPSSQSPIMIIDMLPRRAYADVNKMLRKESIGVELKLGSPVIGGEFKLKHGHQNQTTTPQFSLIEGHLLQPNAQWRLTENATTKRGIAGGLAGHIRIPASSVTSRLEVEVKVVSQIGVFGGQENHLFLWLPCKNILGCTASVVELKGESYHRVPRLGYKGIHGNRGRFWQRILMRKPRTDVNTATRIDLGSRWYQEGDLH